jgi:hypothetical protein
MPEAKIPQAAPKAISRKGTRAVKGIRSLSVPDEPVIVIGPSD